MGAIANGPNLPPPCPISPFDYFPSLSCLGSSVNFESLEQDLHNSFSWAIERLKRFSSSGNIPSITWEFPGNGGFSARGDGLRLSGAEVRGVILLLMLSESFQDSPRDVVLKNFRIDNRPPEDKAGFVYFLHGAGTGFYKIGHTNCLDRRIKQISPKLPFRLELVHSIETDDRYLLESFAHKYFEKKRLEGEWFDLDSMDMHEIKGWGSYLNSSEFFDFMDPVARLQGWEVNDPWNDKEFCTLADRVSWTFRDDLNNKFSFSQETKGS